MHQPTFVNMIRDPIAWFQSHYTFMRFGMNKGRGENDPKLGSVSSKQKYQETIIHFYNWKSVFFKRVNPVAILDFRNPDPFFGLPHILASHQSVAHFGERNSVLETEMMETIISNQN